MSYTNHTNRRYIWESTLFCCVDVFTYPHRLVRTGKKSKRNKACICKRNFYITSCLYFLQLVSNMQLRLSIWRIWFSLISQFFLIVFLPFLLVNKRRGEYLCITSRFFIHGYMRKEKEKKWWPSADSPSYRWTTIQLYWFINDFFRSRLLTACKSETTTGQDKFLLFE